MRWIMQILEIFIAYKQWFLILIATDLLFIFFAWLAYPETFHVLARLMMVFALAMIALAVFMVIRKQKTIEEAFQNFLLEPAESNENLLCGASPKLYWPFIRRMGNALRFYQAELNERGIELSDYENYIEGWVHEIKKPLSLMTLVLDNRSDEMSPLVKKRMLHIRNQMLGDVDRILYYARLGAAHKDYIFEPVNLLEFCKKQTENQKTLLDESGFQIQFAGEEMNVLSDRKGLAFIIEQIIANSTKHAVYNQGRPMLKFETIFDKAKDNTILHISDNGPGVPAEDLPFIFDKGFTGRRGAYTREATGMGLFLVRRMADDLAIRLEAKSESGSGLTISLTFPKVDP